jgi:periplasmic mercuric ion binding protein
MPIRFLAAIAFAGAATLAQASGVRNATLDVKGMDCAACPITVKTVLKRQPGVSDVKVDAVQHTASVTFDPARISPEKLASAVTEAGYPTTPRK